MRAEGPVGAEGLGSAPGGAGGGKGLRAAGGGGGEAGEGVGMPKGDGRGSLGTLSDRCLQQG